MVAVFIEMVCDIKRAFSFIVVHLCVGIAAAGIIRADSPLHAVTYFHWKPAAGAERRSNLGYRGAVHDKGLFASQTFRRYE